MGVARGVSNNCSCHFLESRWALFSLKAANCILPPPDSTNEILIPVCPSLYLDLRWWVVYFCRFPLSFFFITFLFFHFLFPSHWSYIADPQILSLYSPASSALLSHLLAIASPTLTSSSLSLAHVAATSVLLFLWTQSRPPSSARVAASSHAPLSRDKGRFRWSPWILGVFLAAVFSCWWFRGGFSFRKENQCLHFFFFVYRKISGCSISDSFIFISFFFSFFSEEESDFNSSFCKSNSIFSPLP